MKTAKILLLAAALGITATLGANAFETVLPEVTGTQSDILSEAELYEDYGTLIGSQDYEASGALNTVFVSGGSGIYAFGSGATASVATPSVSGATNMLCVQSTGQTGPCAGYTNFSLADAGTYTFVFDYYVPSDYVYGWFRIVHNMSGVDDLTLTATKGSLQKDCVAQLEVPEGKTFTSFKFQTYYYGTAINNSFYIDNVRLYYKAPAPAAITATVYTSSAKTAAFATYADLAAGATVTLPTARAFAANIPTDSYLNGFIVGNTTLAPGAVYTVTADDLAAGALAIVPTFGEIGKPGALVYENTYDSATDYNSKPIQVISMGIGTSNTSGNIWGMGYGSTFSLETPSGMSSPMLKVSGTGGYVPAGYVNGTINVPGTYTLVVDYYIPTEGGNIVLDVGFGGLKSGTNGTQFKEFYGTQGKLTTYTLPFELAAGSSIGGAYISRAYTAGSFYIDTMRMYYTPARPAVSIHVLDAEGEVSVDTNVASGASVTLPSSMPKTGAVLLGFECGGTTYAPGASYTVTASDAMKGFLDFTPSYKSVTPAHPASGDIILQETFDDIADDTVIFNDQSQGGILSAYKNGYIATANLSENTAFAGKQFCFTRGNALNTSYVTTVSGVKGVAVAQSLNGTSRFPVFGLAGGNSNANTSLALTEPGIYTVYADFGLRAEDLANIKCVFLQIIDTEGNTTAYTLGSGLSATALNTVKAEFTVEDGSGIKMITFAAETVTANDNVIFLVDNIELYHNDCAATVGGETIYYIPGEPITLPGADTLGFEPVFTYDGKTYYAGDTVTTDEENITITVDELSVITMKKASLRVTDKPGIRFAGYVDEDTREAASEYGFIVAFDSAALQEHPEYLTHNDAKDISGTANGIKYTSGICYNSADGTDLVYATDGAAFGDTREGYFFTGVLVNIPKSYCKADIVGRPYAVIGGTYVYGQPIKRNLYDMAEAVKADGYTGLDQSGIDYVDGILAE